LLGADITLVARNEEKLEAMSNQLSSENGQKHNYIVADFDNVQEVERKLKSFVANQSVHILVNNTGGPPAGTALDASLEAFQKAFASHLLCNHVISQAVIPGMKIEKFGRIVNVISTSVKMPIQGLGVSNTIRGAVANWAKTLSVEVAPFGITVNNVLPGATMTGRLEAILKNKAEKTGKSLEELQQEMIDEIPANRIGESHEVAAAIAFLCSPAAAYINGINVPVDGGRTGSL
jgi:3-oxoacyl-[acyl-carrier protein] reductase